MKKVIWSLFLALSLVFVASCGSGEKPDDVIFGIDVSHYQGDINWDRVVNSKHPVEFAIVRATMGKDRKDKKYDYNTEGARDRGLVVGAYHYYDPNENSRLQAENFLQTVKLYRGDMRPIVDAGHVSVYTLGEELKDCLDVIEAAYRVKPIICTTLGSWQEYLQKDDTMFADYPLWIVASCDENGSLKAPSFADIFQVTKRGVLDVGHNSALNNSLTKLRL